MRQWVKLVLSGIAFLLVLQAALSFGHFNGYISTQKARISTIETRVALDLPKLQLANQRLQTVANQNAIINYIKRVNTYLQQKGASISLHAIQQITPDTNTQNANQFSELQAVDQRVALAFYVQPWSWISSLSLWPLLFSLLLCIWCYPKLVKKAPLPQRFAHDPHSEQTEPLARLTIDLHQKTLSYTGLTHSVKLSNKPFCFYAALVEHCLQQSTPYVNHSNPVPNDLIVLANRYFYRLIDLGHTKRKKPDFSANLDKTLSEIRAALDELFAEKSADKQAFYPPKAQGEGSRSRRHNYALTQLNRQQIIFLGK